MVEENERTRDWKEELSRYETLGCLHDMFDRQVQLTPGNVAVVDGKKRMTFAELNEACDVLADHLTILGVTPDRPVGIYMERSLEYVISYIAILKAGGAYMPLDVTYPDSLLQDIYADAKPVCVIVNEMTANKLTGQQKVRLCGDWMARLKSSNQKVPSITRSKATLDNLANIVYSSGTTGKPKGIMNPHRAPVFSYTWRHLTYPFAPDDRVASNVFFVWEMLRPLLKGIPLYVIPDSVIYDPLLLSELIKENEITRVLFTPSLLEAVLDAPNLNLSDFASLRIIWFCGEVVTTSLLERCITSLPWVKFVNLYSISECHDVATSDLNQFWEIIKSDTRKPKFAPVGKLCPGIHVAILDDDLNAMTVGMPGEIYVGGPTLSRGYLNRPEVNKKRFIARPDSVSEEVGSTLYRTGDWGLLKPDRNLEICGRCDTMVKIRGYSIEVQAVEAALMSFDIVNACVVVAVGNEGEDKQLVAYLVAEENTTKKMIKDRLKLKLPFYMIPTYFVFLDSLPVLAASAKLDKNALPAVGRKKSALNLSGDDDRVKPATETEQFLESIWCEILQLDFIDVQESFFELGGHSLLAARLLGKIREKYSANVTMQILFANPSINALAQYLDSGESPPSMRPSAIFDLREEVDIHGIGPVNLDIQLRAFWRSQSFGFKTNRARVLLTGATGFLGAYLLRELLLLTKAHVYCLVRRNPEKSPEDRLLENMEFYGVLSESGGSDKDLRKAYKKRVKVITGNVSLLELGLSEEDYTYLSFEIDYVIHAAAYVNLLYPYEALKGTNVSGTRNVLLFARAGKIKPLHYVSTNSVFPNNMVSCMESSSGHIDVKLLENGYSQTKWVAEQMVMKAVNEGMPATIYRIGNISGDRKEAGWNPSDFILLVLRACLMTSTWPDVDWLIEMTPVDFVSNCIVRFSQALHLSMHQVFHIVQPDGISGRWLFDWLNGECGYNLELLQLDEWCNRIESMNATSYDTPPGHPDVRTMLESITSSRDAHLFSYKTTYDQTGFLAAIQTFNLTYPQIDGVLLKTYIEELAKRKIISPPPSRGGNALRGRVAIVTGASSGIGKAIALTFAQAGAKVCLAARSLEKLEQVQQEIQSFGGVTTTFLCDVTKRDEVQEMVKHVEGLWEFVDILVNNAGIMLYTSMSSLKMDEWESMIDVNCKGVVNGIGAVLPGMIKLGSGHIINMSSDAGIVGFPGLAVYSGTKFFVEGMSDALRHEVVNNGIKVTCIRPGDVKTNINTVVIDQEAYVKYNASGTMKVLDPQDVANACLFAATQPEHSAVNSILIEPRLAPV